MEIALQRNITQQIFNQAIYNFALLFYKLSVRIASLAVNEPVLDTGNEVREAIVKKLRKQSKDKNVITSTANIRYILKTTAGDPATVLIGTIVDNTNDNTLVFGSARGGGTWVAI